MIIRFIKSICKMFDNSYKIIHGVVLILSVIMGLLLNARGKVVGIDRQLMILSGVAVLASFFLLTLQNIDFKSLNKYFDMEIEIKKGKYVRESVAIRNTIFSLAVSGFFLIGVCFILCIFNINFIYILLLVLLYLFFGIIYTIVLWNYFASKEKENKK